MQIATFPIELRINPVIASITYESVRFINE